MKRFTLALLLSSLAVGCANVSSSPVQTAGPVVDSMSPTEIKANYSGSVTLSGSGFSGATFQANGHEISTIAGAHLVVQSDSSARIDLTYGGAGHEIDPGFYQITVANSAGQTNAPDVLHVKTFLASVDHVRTLALPFTRTTGKVDFWVRPRDFEGDLLYPGHLLVGSSGLMASNFAWHTTSVTAVGSTTPLPLSTDAIGASSFQFLGEGSGTPIAVAIAIDQSGSMHGLDGNAPSDPTDERITQSEAFVNSLGSQDQAAIYSFQGTSITLVVDFTSDKAALIAGLETLRNGVGGATPLFDAMKAAVNAAGTRPAGFVRAAVVLTDGKDTNSTTTPADVIAAGQAQAVPVFSIGLGNPNTPNSLDPVKMQQIADQTGGRVFLAQDPSALESVFNSLEGTLDSSYEVEADLAFGTPLPAAGGYQIDGTLTTIVDGEQITIVVPTFTISAFN